MKYIILGKSEIIGSFCPTAHGLFNSFSAAHAFATKNMRETPFKVEVAKKGVNC